MPLPVVPPRRRRPTRSVLAAVALTGVVAGTTHVVADRQGGDAAARLAVQARPATYAAGATTATTTATTAASAALDPATTFSVGTFNVLGSQHTRSSTVWAPGTERARTTAALVRAKGIDVIGFQEVQRDQLRVLRKQLPDHRIWPGRKLGRGAVRLQVAWRRDVFDRVASGWVDTPFHRSVRPMPWVELRHRPTQRRIFVIDTHNSPRGLEAERDAATDQQLALINQLRATRRGVLFLGDMNEKREIFCRVVSKTSLLAANGGSARSKRDCSMPEGPQVIDWIFGAGPLAFTGYQRFDGGAVRRASDHALVRAQVVLRPRQG